MKVKVRYYVTLHFLANAPEEELHIKDCETLESLVRVVASKYGKDAYSYLFIRGKVNPLISLLVNGINAKQLDGLETTLHEGDIVDIIPPVGG